MSITVSPDNGPELSLMRPQAVQVSEAKHNGKRSWMMCEPDISPSLCTALD
jgi:hypothetical protein